MTFTSHATHGTANNGAAVEVGTIVHERHEYSALGSVVDHERGRVVGYVNMRAHPTKPDAKDPHFGDLVTWDGKTVLGAITVNSKWMRRYLYGRVWMFSFRGSIDGKSYHGRGQGDGMILKMRRCK